MMTQPQQQPSSTMSSPPQSQQRLAKLQHRVLIYITCYNVLDGVTLTIRKIEQEILAAGHSVCILTTNSGNMNNTNLDGTHPNRHVIFIDDAVPLPFVHDVDKPDLSYSMGFALSPHVLRKMNDYEPSIIHLCATESTSLHLIQYARQKEIPIMGTYHSNIPDYLDYFGISCLKHILRAFFRHQYNFLQALYVPTPYIRQNLIRDGAIDRVTSILIWGRGVDIDKFNPAHRSIEYRNHILGPHNKSVDTPILLWVGRLVCEKRFDIFINIVKRLSAKQCKFHALVVGAGAYEDEIKALPNTTFTGWLSIDQLSTVYASSDVFLFPSAVETFGNVTLEAAASGLPVIVEAGCSGHLVHSEGNGYACPANDEDAFYEATLSLIDDKQLREEFGVCGRELSLSMEKSSVVRQMIENYTQITDQFYTEYSGHHRNRDIEYTRAGSFLLGIYPRPLILIIFEAFFLFIFDMMWKLTSFMIWYNKCIGNDKTKSKETDETETSGTPLVSIAQPASKIPALKLNQSQKDRQDVIDSSYRKKLATIELNDVEIGSGCNSIGASLLSNNSDDNTVATCSSSQNTTSSSSSLTNTIVPTKQSSETGFAHTIVKLFVTTAQFQCRVESRIRQFVSSLFNYNSSRQRQNEFSGAAKRKNSNMTTTAILSVDELGDTSHDTLVPQQRGRNVVFDIDVDVVS